MEKYKTLRYMKRKDLNLTKENSTDDLRNRMEGIDSNTNLVVRLRVNSPVYVEEALNLSRENIHKIAKCVE